jgi:hypothetical protein
MATQMAAFEDRRFLVQSVAVGKPDANGMRELSFPISPVNQITMVLAAELIEQVREELTSET